MKQWNKKCMFGAFLFGLMTCWPDHNFRFAHILQFLCIFTHTLCNIGEYHWIALRVPLGGGWVTGFSKLTDWFWGQSPPPPGGYAKTRRQRPRGIFLGLFFKAFYRKSDPTLEWSDPQGGGQWVTGFFSWKWLTGFSRLESDPLLHLHSQHTSPWCVQMHILFEHKIHTASHSPSYLTSFVENQRPE